MLVIKYYDCIVQNVSNSHMIIVFSSCSAVKGINFAHVLNPVQTNGTLHTRILVSGPEMARNQVSVNHQNSLDPAQEGKQAYNKSYATERGMKEFSGKAVGGCGV